MLQSAENNAARGPQVKLLVSLGIKEYCRPLCTVLKY